MHEGHDGVNGKFMGLKSPNVSEINTFEQFYDEFKKQLKHSAEMVTETVNEFEGYLSYINPQSMFSGTSISCLNNAKCAMAGGTEFNDSDLEIGGFADICDSLAMIKKYVFDKKMLTLSELKAMLDEDFKGNEIWQKRFLADPDKYGNNKELPDFFAKDIVDYLVDIFKDKKNARGGKWMFCFHIAEFIFYMADKTLASPNGRNRGVQLSKNMASSMGQNREGVTAAILSNTKTALDKVCGNTTLDIGILPSAVNGEDGLEAMYGLLNTFVNRGGNSLNINVFNSDILKKAQDEPEKYQDLQIRVSGWNVLFSKMSKEEQDGYILQAEGLQ
jgi:formate C-acetyltransferase